MTAFCCSITLKMPCTSGAVVVEEVMFDINMFPALPFAPVEGDVEGSLVDDIHLC